MGKYIDADELDKKFNEILDNPEEYDKPIHDMMLEFYFAPALDVVEVVRCRDCIHFINHDKRCGYFNHGIKTGDYCSYGERKEHGDD